jgi:hypothetical protein
MATQRQRQSVHIEDQDRLKKSALFTTTESSQTRLGSGLNPLQRSVLNVQRTLGNAAVMRMMADVQRCGGGTCSCGCSDKEEEETPIQRVPDLQTWSLFGKDDDESCQQNPQWQFQYDGCSVPAALAKFMGIDKDNPSGGKDTQFSNSDRQGPCDQHDRCYQTCNTDSDGRKDCDQRMYQDMLAVCNKSSEGWMKKAKCRHWARMYYLGLRVGGGFAWDERQNQVCTSCSPKKKKK